MKSGQRSLVATAIAVIIAVASVFAGAAIGAIGDTTSKHNMKELPGYGLQGSCAACHKPHNSKGKRIWTEDRQAVNDGARNLTTAQSMSHDQGVGGMDYPGIYLCLDCHSASSAAPTWASPAAKVSTHSSRELRFSGYTTKYADFVTSCTDCHDVHQFWDGSFSGGNGYMIRSSIVITGGTKKKVRFTSMSGAGSMGPGTNPVEGVCEVCHTQTKFHRNTYSAATTHNNGRKCVLCHTHSNGFSGVACDSCHGNPPVGASTLVGGSANPGSQATGAASAGGHAFHTRSTAGGAGYACNVCHSRGMGDGANADKRIDVRFRTFGVSTSGRFDSFSPINGYTMSPGNTTGGSLGCSNVYCHGNFAGGVTSNVPVWNNPSTGACGTCHSVTFTTEVSHNVHISAAWGPKAACDDCHPAGSTTGSHATHADGHVSFKDGNTLANTNICDNCHGCTAATKPTWTNSTSGWSQTAWCESCHNGSSTVNTQAGTRGISVTAPNVVGGSGYGYDVTGHGRTGITLDCVRCHLRSGSHIDGKSPTYKAISSNYKVGFRLSVANTVPLLSNYSSGKVKLCMSCHIQSRLLGMPTGGKPSALHMHSIITTDKWYTNFRNMSTKVGKYEGNWDSSGGGDVPTNIHWNHLDDYGSTKWVAIFGRRIYDSDGNGTSDSNVTCKTCHNPHGTNQPAMVFDEFSIYTFTASVLANRTSRPTYRWLGSTDYVTNRCSDYCHSSGDGKGTSGTKWYREPYSGSTVFGVPLGVRAVPLQ